VYTQLLVEVAGGRDLRQAVSAAARSVGLDLGEHLGVGGGAVALMASRCAAHLVALCSTLHF